MTRQVLKLTDRSGKFSVVYHEGDENPYWVYRHNWEPCRSGYGYTDHKRIEKKYFNLESCLYYIAGQL